MTYLWSKEKRVILERKENYFGARAQGQVGISEDGRRALVPVRPRREGMLGGWRETKLDHLFGTLPTKALEWKPPICHSVIFPVPLSCWLQNVGADVRSVIVSFTTNTE